VEIAIASTEHPLKATLERAWIDGVEPRPGRTVPLKILTRTYRGEEVVHTVPVEIPANVSGSLSILVTDGARLAQMEQQEVSMGLKGIPHVIRAANRARKNSSIYVRLLGTSPGAVVAGEPLPSLPPSVLGVMEGDRNSGTFTPLQSAAVREWELRTDYAMSGSRTLMINIDRGR
jgi:hypothetical protein